MKERNTPNQTGTGSATDARRREIERMLEDLYPGRLLFSFMELALMTNKSDHGWYNLHAKRVLPFKPVKIRKRLFISKPDIVSLLSGELQ